MVIKSEILGTEWFFLCGRWLDVSEDDGKIERELLPQNQDGVASAPLIKYRLEVLTGDRHGAGIFL